VEICALLQKQLESRSSKTLEIKKSICPKYMGFQIPDVWIAGYGIDAGEDFRHLPYIVSVNNEYYLE